MEDERKKKINASEEKTNPKSSEKEKKGFGGLSDGKKGRTAEYNLIKSYFTGRERTARKDERGLSIGSSEEVMRKDTEGGTNGTRDFPVSKGRKMRKRRKS